LSKKAMTSRSPETVAEPAGLRERANAEALERLWSSEPVLVDVQRALGVVPGMTPETVLTSGAPLAWDDYFGGQRSGVIGGALYEGLAGDEKEADELIRAGKVRVATCHEHGCIGSLAGIYTASMPVLVVENAKGGTKAFCNLFEGPSPARLNYGVYNEAVRESLGFIADTVGPVLGEAVRTAGGIPLRPIVRRALHMGDELHSRNAAATLLFTRELFLALLGLAEKRGDEVRRTLEYLSSSDYFFLRLSMASSKVTADAAHGVEGSSVVSAMTFNCRNFSIRVSGLGDTWFEGPMPEMEPKLFDGYTPEDVEYMGGESVINETVGLGGFAQAAAFPLQEYQGGSAERMVATNLEMYEITAGEHPEFKIPFFGFRGVPTGIDVYRVVETGILPAMDIGVAGRGGGQIGAGTLRAPLTCFEQAVAEHRRRYS
jgi:Protein of unknown function (DUF1116)